MLGQHPQLQRPPRLASQLFTRRMGNNHSLPSFKPRITTTGSPTPSSPSSPLAPCSAHSDSFALALNSSISRSTSSYSAFTELPTPPLTMSMPATPLDDPSIARDDEGAALSALAKMRIGDAELQLEIDIAMLATEVALRVLHADDSSDSDQDQAYNNVGSNFGRQKAQDDSVHGSLSWMGNTNAWTSSDAAALDAMELGQDLAQASEVPKRKGRARMSQEKRKRLARRKEREAQLYGLPPMPASAPPTMTCFPPISMPPLSSTSQKHLARVADWRPRSALPAVPPPQHNVDYSLSNYHSSAGYRTWGSDYEFAGAVPSLSPSVSRNTSPTQSTATSPDSITASLPSTDGVYKSDLLAAPRLVLQPPTPESKVVYGIKDNVASLASSMISNAGLVRSSSLKDLQDLSATSAPTTMHPAQGSIRSAAEHTMLQPASSLRRCGSADDVIAHIEQEWHAAHRYSTAGYDQSHRQLADGRGSLPLIRILNAPAYPPGLGCDAFEQRGVNQALQPSFLA